MYSVISILIACLLGYIIGGRLGPHWYTWAIVIVIGGVLGIVGVELDRQKKYKQLFG